MIGLGAVLVVLGLLLPVPVLVTLGIILLVVGVVLMLLDLTGRPVGRRWW